MQLAMPKERQEKWAPTSTCGKVFFRLPADSSGVGQLIGRSGASTVGGKQDGQRKVGVDCWVSLRKARTRTDSGDARPGQSVSPSHAVVKPA